MAAIDRLNTATSALLVAAQAARDALTKAQDTPPANPAPAEGGATEDQVNQAAAVVERATAILNGESVPADTTPAPTGVVTAPTTPDAGSTTTLPDGSTATVDPSTGLPTGTPAATPST